MFSWLNDNFLKMTWLWNLVKKLVEDVFGLSMNEKIGEVFSITKDNEPIPGCTTSKAVNDTLTYFSLARNTDISAEIYPYYKMIYVLKGQLEVYGNNGYTKVVKEKESFIWRFDSITRFDFGGLRERRNSRQQRY